ncbi:MAG: MFS transporter [Pseudomonadota bacterium]
MTDAAAPTASAAPIGGAAGFGSQGYRAYVLGALLVIYTFNFIDRILIGLVAEPIKLEFGLSDTMLGLLGGPAFAILYTALGIPIARLAERANRVTIIAVSVFVWSLMTALCGAATTFWMLAAFRVGVSIGEAGCTPPANSLIADYFKPSSRAAALSIYAMGITIGGVCAGLFAALLIDQFSWRAVFYAVGAPGILVAIIAKLTIKEPPRGYTDPPGTSREKASFSEALKTLSGKPTFWHMVAGATLASFVGYALSNFTVSFFVRTHELGLSDAILLAGVFILTFGAIGTYLSGFLAERLVAKHKNVLAWLPALGFVIATPAYIIGFNASSIVISTLFLMVAALTHYFYLGPMYAIGQGVVDARMRATAIAILLFIVNLIGYGGGPIFIGVLSDIIANMSLSGSDLTVGACSAEGLTADQDALCSQASADGLRLAASITVLIYLWAGVHYMLAGRTLQKDMVAA